MIILLGATGYIGQAFEQALAQRGLPFLPFSRSELDYTRFDVLLRLLRERRPEFLINAAGYTGKPNVDACESARADVLHGNVLFPHTVAHACLVADVPWGHVSSGCIYSGAKIIAQTGVVHIEKDLNKPAIRDLIESASPAVQGFKEEDPPNFSFRNLPCSFYSGTKALGEEALAGMGRAFLWRLRIPFDEFDDPRNYLTKVQIYPKVYDNFNSLSHRSDFAHACLDLWQQRAPFGTYNVTNPGFTSSRQVIKLIERILKPDRSFQFWSSDEEFYKSGAKAPRSNCILDVSKLLSTGITIRPVEEALETALRAWSPARRCSPAKP